ncbi:MAG: ribbon-helix-helix protein, CopG family [Thermoleophilia bacterium]
MSNVVATRFSDEVLGEIDDVARELRRTRAEVIRRAVEVYLVEFADQQIALDRLTDPIDPVLTTEQTWDELRWGKPEASG